MEPVIVSIDPGKFVCWCALWTQRAAEFIDVITLDMAKPLHPQVGAYRATQVVSEIMVVRDNGKNVDPRDLVAVTWAAGLAAQAFHPMRVPIPTTPENWKGQVSKETTMRRVRACFTEYEIARLDASLKKFPAGKRHNAYDAIGIGARLLGRI